MSDKLTPNDPVVPEILAQFSTLADAKRELALTLLSLENEKVRIIASARKIEEQLTRLFEACLVERGLPPDAVVEIDPKTGKITVVGGLAEPPPVLVEEKPA